MMGLWISCNQGYKIPRKIALSVKSDLLGHNDSCPKVAKVTKDGFAFQSTRLIKATSSSKLSMSPPRPRLCAQHAQYFCLYGNFLVRTDRPEADPDPPGTPHKGSFRQSQNKKETFTLG